MPVELFEAFIEEAIERHARDSVKSGKSTAVNAEVKSRAEVQSILINGHATPNHDFFVIVDRPSMVEVGTIWIGEIERGGRRLAFIYDIRVYPYFRQAGHASRAIESIFKLAKERDLDGVGLHTFGHNVIAQALYRKLGFGPVSITMERSLR
jgi:ribosomal protein S18 acetylase RimI-like enzyme